MPGSVFRVAVASDDGSTVGSGHFAHNKLYLIFDVGGGEARLVESRVNPFAAGPSDKPTHSGSPVGELRGLHGVAKYSKLRELVLSDVDMVVASGGCPTSVAYFSSQGVVVAFTDPGIPVDDLVEALKHARPEDLGIPAEPK